MSTYASPQIEIAITGRGVVSSIGEGADAFVDALLGRRSGVVDGLAPCADFDPESAMSAKVARRSDRYTQLAFAAAVEAA
ncbi:MAG: 3-oxoacyl-[acyl-carrier-protein] synthase, partial [Solirubrobacteraceae bacterium]|nr:3-oxoacyl-[acyl-carrier-protein] synthase [Solirubrobacteraceae bacterium]